MNLIQAMLCNLGGGSGGGATDSMILTEPASPGPQFVEVAALAAVTKSINMRITDNVRGDDSLKVLVQSLVPDSESPSGGFFRACSIMFLITSVSEWAKSGAEAI